MLPTTGTLVLPNTTSPPTFGATVNVSEFGNTLNTTSDTLTSGGNFLGSFNGSALSATYCLNLTLGISVPGTFDSANETTDGTIYGTAVPNAGAISWLMQNIAPTATTPDQQAALQAAIWRTEYGPNGFQVNSIDNGDTDDTTGEEALMQPYYQSDLKALGNNTAPVNQVVWISPDAAGMAQGLVALQASPPPSHEPAQGNWAGYVAEASPAASGAVTAVSGDWTVPKVSGVASAAMDVWVGIDGEGNDTVEQVGITGDIDKAGKAEYYAWYQMRPGPERRIKELKIKPGDKISASVVYMPSTNSFIVKISVNKEKPVTKVGLNPPGTSAQRLSAEWIIEETGGPGDAFSGPTFLPLANFDDVKFSKASATINGNSGPINNSAWHNQSLSFSSLATTGAKGANASALTNGGTGFTVTCTP